MASEISPHALIDPNAQIGKNVAIGPYTIIHKNVVINDNVTIGSHCEIGVTNSFCDETPLTIGKNANIRSHSILYGCSTIGDSFETGHRVTIREQTKIGKSVRIGTLCDIQGHCKIGDFTRLHSNVHIGQKSDLAHHVWIFPYVVLTNDPTPPSETLIGCKLNEFSIICTMSTILPGVEIGRDSLVAASSCVTKNVPPERIVIGVPAKDIGHVSKIKLKGQPEKPAYPWRQHYHKGYSQKDIEKWIQEFSE